MLTTSEAESSQSFVKNPDTIAEGLDGRLARTGSTRIAMNDATYKS
jgi:hypothetical protein